MPLRARQALLLATPFFSLAACQAQSAHLTIQVDRPKFTISPTFYGLMTEEINHAYDGGLYGELLQNRALKDNPEEAVHWSPVTDGGASAALKLEQGSTVAGSRTALRLDIAAPGTRAGLANDGYWGIPVRPDTRYRVSFYAMASDGLGPVTVDIEGKGDSKPVASARIPSLSGEWKKYTLTLTTGNVPASKDGRFVISAGHIGTLWVSEASLFPPTYRNRPNGDRIDLMQKLGDLNPSFLRLPGGNYLEGNTIADRFEWKNTLGDPDDRSGHQGPWGYRSSDGLGLLEFLEWCEDLHMQPVLAVYAGYSLRGEHVNPGPDLAPYVQNGLDEIEYLTGGTDTQWGKARADGGHPKPFPLTYVEIGNEDEFDRSGSYDGRFAQFYDAIKAKYPKLQIIATAPIRSRKPDVVDDHYYRPAAAMERDANHYDGYSRTGPKIFVGEWASIQGNPTPTYMAALGDAAWLTGLEHNSDLIVMESYAPLLVNVNRGAAQWPTNLIGYDSLASFGSPSFYVQSMFGKNTGELELPVDLKVDEGPQPPPAAPHGSVGVGTFRTQAEFKDISVTHDGTTTPLPVNSGWKATVGTWEVDGDVLRQTGRFRDTHDTAGDATWTDYTINLKARKLTGAEGFFVLFHCQDPQNYYQWNVGGWNDTQSAIQRTQDGDAEIVGEPSTATVESGRWYDVKVEVHGNHASCYLDGKLVNEADEAPRAPVAPIYTAASRSKNGNEVIVKLVNVSAQAMPVQIDLAGIRSVSPNASGLIMTGQLTDQNTVEQPEKVAPKPLQISNAGTSFSYTIPGQSVVVLRLQTKG